MPPTDDVATDAEIPERIRWLYGLDGVHDAQVGRGVLPARYREFAPDWENDLRRRLHASVNPRDMGERIRRPHPVPLEAAVEQALVEAGVRVVPSESGNGRCIDAAVDREVRPMSEDWSFAATDADMAKRIRRLYGLNGIHRAQVERGMLPAPSRQGAPDWENRLRRRLNASVNPNLWFGPAVAQALVEADVPLIRENGRGPYIDPAVPRQVAQEDPPPYEVAIQPPPPYSRATPDTDTTIMTGGPATDGYDGANAAPQANAEVARAAATRAEQPRPQPEQSQSAQTARQAATQAAATRAAATRAQIQTLANTAVASTAAGVEQPGPQPEQSRSAQTARQAATQAAALQARIPTQANAAVARAAAAGVQQPTSPHRSSRIQTRVAAALSAALRNTQNSGTRNGRSR